MKTLIGMREFTLLEFSKRNAYYYQDSKVLNKINNYANFLSRQPQLSDFVACGEDGLPLTNKSCMNPCSPSDFSESGLCGKNGCYKESSDYNKALDKVLFKGFEIEYWDGRNSSFACKHKESGFQVCYYKATPEYFEWGKHTSIESLTPYKLELTDNANKKIGV